jgi:formiminotetrahydrofolate cyclodeaminase
MNTLPSTSLLSDLSLKDFLASLAEDTPAPGGGAAAALAGSLGAALAGMLARFTLGRPRYVEAAERMQQRRDQADALRDRLTGLVDADARAYLAVAGAYRLPKDDESQRTARAETIQEALRGAIRVPLEVASACLAVMEMLAPMIAEGNPSARTDGLVGALLANAGLESSLRNVRANLQGMHDEAFAGEAAARAAELLMAAQKALAVALAAAGGGD